MENIYIDFRGTQKDEHDTNQECVKIYETMKYTKGTTCRQWETCDWVWKTQNTRKEKFPAGDVWGS